MLSDEKMKKIEESIENHLSLDLDAEKLLQDHELNIKLKAMEETERKMIEKFKLNLSIMFSAMSAAKDNVFNGVDIPISSFKKMADHIIGELEKEFNEKWFK